jgi:hypothetical protein
MSYNVSTLADYTQPNEKVLLTKAVLAARTIERLKKRGNIMTGVKSKSQLPQLDTDAVFQSGAGCGFSASGATNVTARAVEVGKIKVQEALCPSDLEDKYTQLELTAGSDYNEAVFAADYSDLKVKKIGKAMETAVWNGDKASGNAQLNKFDGFRKLIKADGTVVNGNPTNILIATGITKTNVEGILDGIIDLIPEDVREKDDVFIACGYEVFRAYLKALRDKNLYDVKVDGEVNEIKVVGSTVPLVYLPGLNGTSELFATHWGNLFFATDLLDEQEKFELKYAEEAGEVRFSAKWKAGVQYAFGSEIVKFVLA